MLHPLGYYQVTATGTAFPLPSLPPNNTGNVYAVIQAEAFALRWRDDGTDPTATVGMPLAAGDSMEYDGPLTAIRFIAATAGAILNVTYYRSGY